MQGPKFNLQYCQKKREREKEKEKSSDLRLGHSLGLHSIFYTMRGGE
jgi:hypothetical protein